MEQITTKERKPWYEVDNLVKKVRNALHIDGKTQEETQQPVEVLVPKKIRMFGIPKLEGMDIKVDQEQFKDNPPHSGEHLSVIQDGKKTNIEVIKVNLTENPSIEVKEID